MKEYIEREKLNDYLDTPFTMSMGFLSTDVCKGANKAREIFKHIFDELPSADVREVVHGKWIEIIPRNSDYRGFKCNKCGAQFQGIHRDNFCGNCGARMDGDGE